MHAEVYRRVPGAGAVVHTHADNCVALAALRKPIPAFHYMIHGFGGDDVPCVGYFPFGTPELGRAAGAALEGRAACLLANHGMLTRGATLGAAFDAAIRLEVLARQYRLALTAGKPVLLNAAEMKRVAERYLEYGRQPKPPARRRWMVP
jgi:L-fuculose-phosphate aldolase